MNSIRIRGCCCNITYNFIQCSIKNIYLITIYLESKVMILAIINVVMCNIDFSFRQEHFQQLLILASVVFPDVSIFEIFVTNKLLLTIGIGVVRISDSSLICLISHNAIINILRTKHLVNRTAIAACDSADVAAACHAASVIASGQAAVLCVAAD